MMAGAACQIKILAECRSMFSHEAQLEYNQLHSEPLHIISLNICPMPPRCSRTKGTVWLMILSHSASAALSHRRSDLNLHVNHSMLTERMGADVNLCSCAIASALIKMSMSWIFETLLTSEKMARECLLAFKLQNYEWRLSVMCSRRCIISEEDICLHSTYIDIVKTLYYLFISLSCKCHVTKWKWEGQTMLTGPASQKWL